MVVLLRISGIIKDSIVDGPGLRFVVFTQGCKHACLGCHNPQTHDLNGGYDIGIDELNELLTEQKLIRGVTLSGGEPFLQAEFLANIAKKIHTLGLNVWSYTGYTYEDLLKRNDSHQIELLNNIDVLVDGAFVLKERNLTLKFRGSNNQRVIDLNKTRELKNIVLKYTD